MPNLIKESLREPLPALDDGRLDNKRGVTVLSHPRSGTHLTIDFLRRNFPDLSPKKPLFAPLDALYVSLDAVLIEGPSSTPVKRSVYGLSHHPFPVIKTHWVDSDMKNLSIRNKSLAEWLEVNTTKIYVVRNPVHVFSSLYAFECRIGATDVNTRAWVEKKSRYWARHIEAWSSRADVTVIRFEDIIAFPDVTLKTIAMALPNLKTVGCSSVALLPPPTRSILKNRLQRFSRSPGSTEILSVGDKCGFNDLFSVAEREVFWQNVEKMCQKFGYPVAKES